MGRLDERVAVVTGAASGIGRASALAMAAEGAAVAVADIDIKGAREVAAEIDGLGGRGLAVEVDVAEPVQVRDMVSATVDAFGGIDILHNNAAAVAPDLLAGDTDVVDIDLELWDYVMRVNLRGPMLGCKYAIPIMCERGGGSIINTSSVSSVVGDLTRCAYGSSKGGLNSLTRFVAVAFGHRGIRCNAVLPGLVLTPAARAFRSPDMLDEFASHHLLPLGEPEDIANLVVFLASDEGRFMTGQALTADGGLTAHMPTYAQSIRRKDES